MTRTSSVALHAMVAGKPVVSLQFDWKPCVNDFILDSIPKIHTIQEIVPFMNKLLADYAFREKLVSANYRAVQPYLDAVREDDLNRRIVGLIQGLAVKN